MVKKTSGKAGAFCRIGSPGLIEAWEGRFAHVLDKEGRPLPGDYAVVWATRFLVEVVRLDAKRATCRNLPRWLVQIDGVDVAFDTTDLDQALRSEADEDDRRRADTRGRTGKAATN
jgi:hypothetical protein